MKYISIDVETTGLDWDHCQILEIGAVYDDTDKPFQEAKLFSEVARMDAIRGEPYALQMNAHIIRASMKRGIYNLTAAFGSWLGEGKTTPAGKNFSSFDARFLETGGFDMSRLRHRVLDPGSMYAMSTDAQPPDLKTCCLRAGFEPFGPAHRGLPDALTVCRLIRAKWGLDTEFDPNEVPGNILALLENDL